MKGKISCQCEIISDEEKRALLDDILEEYKEKKGSLIQILHMAQGIYGFLPVEVQKHIALKLGIPLSKVSGVISFYSLFTTEPRGRYVIRVCLGTACYVRGGGKILDRLKEMLKIDINETTEDMKYTLEVMRCIGACGLAPAISINDVVYKQVNPDKLHEILNHLE